MTNVTLSTQSSLTQLGSTSYSSSVTTYASTTTAEAAMASNSVTLSGRAIMLSRLFHTTDPNANPKIEYQTTTDNLSGSVYSFLTAQDRSFISKLYEYAQARGIDFQKVDAVAFDLGGYRMDGGDPHVATDMNGNLSYIPLNARDEAIAQRILTSKAMSDTEVDHGFVKAVLNPTKMSVHASDFGFLQEFVFAFSATGSDGSADPNAQPIEKLPPPSQGTFLPPVSMLESGYNTMLSRLFGDGGNRGNEIPHSRSVLLGYLTDTDKQMLASRYAEAQKRGEDLGKVDKMAMKLAAQRVREQALADFLNNSAPNKKDKKNIGETRSTAASDPKSMLINTRSSETKNVTSESQLRTPAFK